MRMTPVGQAAEIDPHPVETREWLEALQSVTETDGAARAQYRLRRLEDLARDSGDFVGGQPYSAYRNTVPVAQQGSYPGDLALEERLTSIIRWNALAMVVRANKAYGELGGHVASYASAAEISKPGSTISSAPPRRTSPATSSTTSRIPPRACTPGPSSRAG